MKTLQTFIYCCVELFQIIFKTVLKCMEVLLLFGSVLALIVIGVFTAKGYEMYQDAVTQNNLTEKIAAIQSDDNYVCLNDISSEFKQQLLVSEDNQFYKHGGISIKSIFRAVTADIKARGFVQGGSTITQQLAKNLYFTSEKRVERKIAELFVVHKLEKEYSKDEILELYCNVIYFGEGCYGIQEAAVNYYGINAGRLNKEQAASLVFTIKCPNYYNPNVYSKKEEAAVLPFLLFLPDNINCYLPTQELLLLKSQLPCHSLPL